MADMEKDIQRLNGLLRHTRTFGRCRYCGEPTNKLACPEHMDLLTGTKK